MTIEQHLRQRMCRLLCAVALVCGNAHSYAAAKKAQEKDACPSRNFSEFIKAFSENEAVQRRFTKYPLQQLEVDNANYSEPTPVERILRAEQVSFPVMPDQAKMKKHSFEVEIRQRSPSRGQVHISSPDSDSFVVDYHFRKDSCWYLERIEDWSL